MPSLPPDFVDLLTEFAATEVRYLVIGPLNPSNSVRHELCGWLSHRLADVGSVFAGGKRGTPSTVSETGSRLAESQELARRNMWD
ncbi:MAG: hypothetical protein ABI627_17705 [Polyangiaceae bacterium]